MIKAAPRSFAIATIVPTLAFVVAIWLALNWSYNGLLAGKDQQNAILRDRLAAYQDKLQGATPDQAAGELKRLRAEIDALKNPPRDEHSLYQRGRLIGVTAGAVIDSQNKIVQFTQITVGGELDKATNVEFRDLKLLYKTDSGVSSSRQGLVGTTTYLMPIFAILGSRFD